MSIVYKKGSLFDAPKGSVLVHAMSAKGVWGKGIAKEFRDRFPQSYEIYKNLCDNKTLDRGQAFVLPTENEYRVGCLITSYGYCDQRDSKNRILENTRLALLDILGATNKLNCYIELDEEIHSNKFNSGLFGVEWNLTEKILVEVMKETGYSKDWTIWSL